MPLNKPVLDDRSYIQIRDDLVARIPVYAPEWTDHNVSDPGIALIELFSYLTESIVFRFNQIPDTTQMEFLRLLQIPLNPAVSARAMLSFTTKEVTGARVPLDSVALAGEVAFSTQDEVRVLPVEAVAVAKSVDEMPEEDSEEGLFYAQAAQALGLSDTEGTAPYRASVVWAEDPGTPRDFDATVDGIMWIAVLAEKASEVEATRAALTDHEDAPLLLNIGFVPEIEVEPVSDTTTAAFADRFRCPGLGAEAEGAAVEWQVSTGSISAQGDPVYARLKTKGDTSSGMTASGVIRVELPRGAAMAPFAVDDPNLAGTGDFPPQLDDALETRVVFWLRAFRPDGRRFGRVLYVGANAARVDQTLGARAEFLGLGTGQPDQVVRLGNTNVIAQTVLLQVEAEGRWLDWSEVDHFDGSAAFDRHFTLDKEAGLIRFGSGLNGAVPQIGQRIRVSRYRYGGGTAGNVAAGAISKLRQSLPVKLENPLAAYGGADAETVAEGLARIPTELRRRNRAVTSEDFRDLALATPGATLGRAEVLPLYHPQLPDRDSAGVVSVIVWPRNDPRRPNAPLPTTQQIKATCQFLDEKRLVTTELYVMPPKYRPIAVAAGVRVKPGYGIDAVRHWVELVLRQYLAPLPPFGPSGGGWPLGRRVSAAELLAAAHQVEGVEIIEGLELAGWDDDGTQMNGTVTLARNEVPELIGITVESGPVTVDPGTLLNPAPTGLAPVPIPVLRDEC